MSFIYLPCPLGPNHLVLGYTYAYVLKSKWRVPRPTPTPEPGPVLRQPRPQRPFVVQDALWGMEDEADRAELEREKSEPWLDFSGLVPTKPTCTGPAWDMQQPAPGYDIWAISCPAVRAIMRGIPFIGYPSGPSDNAAAAYAPGPVRNSLPPRRSVDDFFDRFPPGGLLNDTTPSLFNPPPLTQAGADDAFVTTANAPGQGSMGFPLGVRHHTGRRTFAPGDVVYWRARYRASDGSASPTMPEPPSPRTQAHREKMLRLLLSRPEQRNELEDDDDIYGA
ncbi:hypothetical protein PLIIFM63780_007514 [Purpureocillium lilacinum]|nr:hypothetical protein PLIIFM63780_007514 [Purpureocillium lilacinum]